MQGIARPDPSWSGTRLYREGDQASAAGSVAGDRRARTPRSRAGRIKRGAAVGVSARVGRMERSEAPWTVDCPRGLRWTSAWRPVRACFLTPAGDSTEVRPRVAAAGRPRRAIAGRLPWVGWHLPKEGAAARRTKAGRIRGKSDALPRRVGPWDASRWSFRRTRPPVLRTHVRVTAATVRHHRPVGPRLPPVRAKPGRRWRRVGARWSGSSRPWRRRDPASRTSSGCPRSRAR